MYIYYTYIYLYMYNIYMYTLFNFRETDSLAFKSFNDGQMAANILVQNFKKFC